MQQNAHPEGGPDASFHGHPRALPFILLCQTGFAFSIAGMQSIGVLYLSTYLFQPGHIGHIIGFAPVRSFLAHLAGSTAPAALASVEFGVAGACAFLTPLLCGLISDRVMTRRQAVLLGASLCAAGQLLVAVETTFLAGLVLLLIGIGFVGGNIAAQLGELYAHARAELADAFQAIHICGNLAGILGPLVCGYLGQMIAWRWGYVAASCGMLLGLAGYAAGLRYLPPDPARRASGALARPPLAQGDGKVVLALLGLLPALILVGLANGQINNAYLVWGSATYRLRAFGHAIPASWLAAADAGFAVAASVAVIAFWRHWSRRRRLPDDLTRMAIGAAIAAAAPLVLALASAQAAASGQRVGLAWAVGFHTLDNLGIAAVTPVAAAVFARKAPRAVAAMMMGVLNLEAFVRAIATGILGALLGQMSGTAYWLLHAALVAAGALGLVVLRRAAGATLGGATPSGATPGEATPSEATPSEATPGEATPSGAPGAARATP